MPRCFVSAVHMGMCVLHSHVSGCNHVYSVPMVSLDNSLSRVCHCLSEEQLCCIPAVGIAYVCIPMALLRAAVQAGSC